MAGGVLVGVGTGVMASRTRSPVPATPASQAVRHTASIITMGRQFAGNMRTIVGELCNLLLNTPKTEAVRLATGVIMSIIPYRPRSGPLLC